MVGDAARSSGTQPSPKAFPMFEVTVYTTHVFFSFFSSLLLYYSSPKPVSLALARTICRLAELTARRVIAWLVDALISMYMSIDTCM